MNFVAIGVRLDNLMYIIYDDDYAISVDSYDPDIINEALSCRFDKQFYKSEELKQLKNTFRKRELLGSLTTHSHFDHSNGDKKLKMMFPNIKQISGFSENACEDGQVIKLKDFKIECIDTKCHTQDSFCFYVNDRWLFTGDTIFFLGCGYFNDGTGSQMAEAFLRIKERVNTDALVLYGHDYRENDIQFVKNIPQTLLKKYEIPANIGEKMWLTLGEEIRYNPFFRILEIEGDKASNFSKMREAKNNFKI